MRGIKKIYIEFAAFCFYLFIMVINKTLRLKIIGADKFYSLNNAGKNIVFVFWHQATFIPLYHYRNRKACLLTMKSVKGEVLARMCERLGYQVTRLATEDDAKGFRQMLNLIKEGYDSNLAVDGPDGPIFKMKPGAIFLAKKLGNPILPVVAAARPAWTLFWRWDKYFVPWPFAKALILFGDPIDPTTGSIEELRERCEKALRDLNHRAQKEV